MKELRGIIAGVDADQALAFYCPECHQAMAPTLVATHEADRKTNIWLACTSCKGRGRRTINWLFPNPDEGLIVWLTHNPCIGNSANNAPVEAENDMVASLNSMGRQIQKFDIEEAIKTIKTAILATGGDQNVMKTLPGAYATLMFWESALLFKRCYKNLL